jgi:hypothetical protein
VCLKYLATPELGGSFEGAKPLRNTYDRYESALGCAQQV